MRVRFPLAAPVRLIFKTMRQKFSKFIFFLSLITFLLSGCYFSTQRYFITLHDGFFTSELTDVLVDGIGVVTLTTVTVSEISQENYKKGTKNQIIDKTTNNPYEVKLEITTIEKAITLDLLYIGTNNNQPDSYVFNSEYQNLKVNVLLIAVDEEKDLKLKYFEYRFYIYEAGDHYTYRLNLNESHL